MDTDKTYEYLRGTKEIREAVVLQTCNRFEIYFLPGSYSILDGLDGFLGDKVARYRVMHGDETIRHLFEVAAGLRSMVTGEDEILGQVRDAWSRSKRKGMNGPAIDEIFSKAIELGRTVRATTSMGRIRRSVSREAVDIFEEAGGADPVLVIGAGRMGTKLARLLTERGHSVYVTDRTPERSAILSEEVGAGVVPYQKTSWSDFPSIFAAVKLEAPLMRNAELDCLSAGIVVDVSVPHAIEKTATVKRKMVTMEDISVRLDELREARSDLAQKAMCIVDNEYGKYVAYRNDMRREELLKKLYLITDGIVSEQLAEILRRTKLDIVQKQIVEKGLQSQRSKILSIIVQSLKESEQIWDSDFVREIERVLDEYGQVSNYQLSRTG